MIGKRNAARNGSQTKSKSVSFPKAMTFRIKAAAAFLGIDFSKFVVRACDKELQNYENDKLQ